MFHKTTCVALLLKSAGGKIRSDTGSTEDTFEREPSPRNASPSIIEMLRANISISGTFEDEKNGTHIQTNNKNSIQTNNENSCENKDGTNIVHNSGSFFINVLQ